MLARWRCALNVLALESMQQETVCLQWKVNKVFSPPRPPVKQGGVLENGKRLKKV